jgi:hypothetical protein
MKKTALDRFLKRRIRGGLTAYVFIMFGVAIMMYMFGFHNMMGTGITGDTGYRSTSSLDNDNASDISNPEMQTESNPVLMGLNSILRFAKDNIILVAGGIGGLILFAVGSFILGANMTVLYQYIVPIAFLTIFLNYFVFPINPGSAELQHMELGPGLPVSIVLIIFFNLFFILSIIAYVRTGET